MKRFTILTFQYYRTLIIYNITFTILCVVLTSFSAGINLVTLFFCKFIGFASAVGLHYYSAFKTYFYYRNAGVSIRRLHLYAWVIDFGIFLLITFFLTLCRHLF